MTEQLGRRYALMMLVSMGLAAVMGMVAWGPILLTADAHRYADERAWFGVGSAANVLVNIPIFALGAWGWRATRASRWPDPLRTPWRLFHLYAMLSAASAALYHLVPNDPLFVLARVCTASGFVALTLGFLAERVHPKFGSALCCRVAFVMIGMAGVAMLLSRPFAGGVDMRPLLLLEILPALLIPAGALSLPGRSTRPSDWIVVLLLYTFAKLLELGDEAVFRATGWFSGHTLMHVALAAAVGWMAYCATVSREAAAASPFAPAGDDNQHESSLNTAS